MICTEFSTVPHLCVAIVSNGSNLSKIYNKLVLHGDWPMSLTDLVQFCSLNPENICWEILAVLCSYGRMWDV